MNTVGWVENLSIWDQTRLSLNPDSHFLAVESLADYFTI